MAEHDKIKIVVKRAPKPDIKITVNSPIPLFYRDENDVYSLPIETSCLFDLGFAICDARYEKDECWSGTEEVEILKDYITEYTGVEDMAINIRGYRGTVAINFNTDPYTMHIVITDYPALHEVTCDKPTPHFDSGCNLLLHYDDDNDGILDLTDSVKAKLDGMTEEEVDFIKKSLMKGTINALCPGCFVPPPECNIDADCAAGYICEAGKCVKKEVLPNIKITVDSPIPLFYRDENDVYSLPIETSCLFDLGFAICDARYPKDECWSGTEEVEILKDYITEYTGVEDMAINIRGYRGTVAINFNTDPYTMHIVITEYPSVKPLWPVTITASELRWTNGTYRTAFTVSNLVSTTKYRIGIRTNRDKIRRDVTGITSYDIAVDISKADLDKEFYQVTCEVYNLTIDDWETTKKYLVPPYELKGTVHVGDSSIPTTIYLDEVAKFGMSVENIGAIEREYAVVLTFRGVDVTKEYRFPPENTVRIPAGKSAINEVSVVMPTDAIPADKTSAAYDLFITLEIFI